MTHVETQQVVLCWPGRDVQLGSSYERLDGDGDVDDGGVSILVDLVAQASGRKRGCAAIVGVEDDKAVFCALSLCARLDAALHEEDGVGRLVPLLLDKVLVFALEALDAAAVSSDWGSTYLSMRRCFRGTIHQW